MTNHSQQKEYDIDITNVDFPAKYFEALKKVDFTKLTSKDWGLLLSVVNQYPEVTTDYWWWQVFRYVPTVLEDISWHLHNYLNHSWQPSIDSIICDTIEKLWLGNDQIERNLELWSNILEILHYLAYTNRGKQFTKYRKHQSFKAT